MRMFYCNTNGNVPVTPGCGGSRWNSYSVEMSEDNDERNLFLTVGGCGDDCGGRKNTVGMGDSVASDMESIWKIEQAGMQD